MSKQPVARDGAMGMPVLQRRGEAATNKLACTVFAASGCDDFDVAVMEGATSWQAHTNGSIRIPYRKGELTIAIGYDEREAPFARGRVGCGVPLLSLADEGNHVACAWAVPQFGSQLVGVGIDLVSVEDFKNDVSGERFIQLLFTDEEHSLVQERFADDPYYGYAVVFGAKEAAFKSTAEPLRRWYAKHDIELEYDIRHFCMEAPHLVRGTARDGAAQHALDSMGVTRIEVQYAAVDTMALVVATAYEGTEHGLPTSVP